MPEHNTNTYTHNVFVENIHICRYMYRSVYLALALAAFRGWFAA